MTTTEKFEIAERSAIRGAKVAHRRLEAAARAYEEAVELRRHAFRGALEIVSYRRLAAELGLSLAAVQKIVRQR